MSMNVNDRKDPTLAMLDNLPLPQYPAAPRATLPAGTGDEPGNYRDWDTPAPTEPTLTPYLRQFRHNDGSEGFVFAYEQVGTDREFARLRADLAAEKRKTLELQRTYDERGNQIGRLEVACARALAAQQAPTGTPKEPTWELVTHAGQVQVGDKLRFMLCDEVHNVTAKLILHAGTDKEEIIYNKARNYYLITSMTIAGKGSQKNVEVLIKDAP
jgi:hypothetical protein